MRQNVCTAGWAISGFYGYLKGVKNELANRYLPGIEPRKDALAGPLGRKSDQASQISIPSESQICHCFIFLICGGI